MSSYRALELQGVPLTLMRKYGSVSGPLKGPTIFIVSMRLYAIAKAGAKAGRWVPPFCPLAWAAGVLGVSTECFLRENNGVLRTLAHPPELETKGTGWKRIDSSERNPSRRTVIANNSEDGQNLPCSINFRFSLSRSKVGACSSVPFPDQG